MADPKDPQGELSNTYFVQDRSNQDKWTAVPSDYEETYQQALKEMQQPDFVAKWTILTAWGTRRDGGRLSMRGLLLR
jgi:hypothetical protein